MADAKAKWRRLLLFPFRPPHDSASCFLGRISGFDPFPASEGLPNVSQVKTYSKGDFFGEIALLLGEPRKARGRTIFPHRTS